MYTVRATNDDGLNYWSDRPERTFDLEQEATALAYFDSTVGRLLREDGPMDHVTVQMFNADTDDVLYERRIEAAEQPTLGSCGCTDYHLADCPTRTSYYDEPEYEF